LVILGLDQGGQISIVHNVVGLASVEIGRLINLFQAGDGRLVDHMIHARVAAVLLDVFVRPQGRNLPLLLV
jgi:hypothetical protein